MEKNLYIETLIIGELENLKVFDIIDVFHGSWNLELINQIFNERDVHVVLWTPTLQNMDNNIIVWRLEDDGEYSVRSVYKIIMENLMDYGGLSMEGEWNMISKLIVPPMN